MTETQVLMTVSNFFGCFSRYHFLEGALLFNSIGSSFIFKWGEGAPRGLEVDGGEFQKKLWIGRGRLPIPPCYGKPWLAALKNETPLQVFSCEF